MSFIRTTEPRGSTSPSAGLGRSSSPEQGSPSVGFSSQQQWLKGLFFMFCTPQYRFISALVQSVMSPLPNPSVSFRAERRSLCSCLGVCSLPFHLSLSPPSIALFLVLDALCRIFFSSFTSPAAFSLLPPVVVEVTAVVFCQVLDIIYDLVLCPNCETPDKTYISAINTYSVGSI